MDGRVGLGQKWLSALGSRLSALGSRLSALGSRLSALKILCATSPSHCQALNSIFCSLFRGLPVPFWLRQTVPGGSQRIPLRITALTRRPVTTRSGEFRRKKAESGLARIIHQRRKKRLTEPGFTTKDAVTGCWEVCSAEIGRWEVKNGVFGTQHSRRQLRNRVFGPSWAAKWGEVCPRRARRSLAQGMRS